MRALQQLILGFVIGLVVTTWSGSAEAAPRFATELRLDAAERFADLASEVGGMGSACLHALDRIGLALGLDVPARAVGDAASGRLPGLGLVFAGLMVVVALGLGRMRWSVDRRRLDVVRRLIEQGHEVPCALLEGPARRDRHRGVVLGFAGMGLFVAGVWLHDRGLAASGLVPAFIGLGYLVSHRLSLGGRQREAPESEDNP
jgi:hypothetical protein